MHTIGTAGHVDHGKSTLVEALTGIDPDRLAEEKARGLTIDLGFAWLTLPGGREVSIVDVPGHERFVHNMLAGVGGIDACLFVVAADEGVMPQTREHLDIISLLGIERGVIALTKIDLVDDEWAELVEQEVREAFAPSSLAAAPLVRVSATTGAGLDDLQLELDRALDAAPDRPDEGRPRLPIDRAFTMAGFGTVVTGTLSGGRLRVSDELTLLPGGRRVRVRGLQSHRATIEEAAPGRRVAVNLSGISVAEAPRGQVLSANDAVFETRRVDARLRLLPHAPRALKPGERLAWHTGTTEVVASLRYLESEPIPPGGEGWVQWRLSAPVALAKGDPYIVRRLSPPMTVGGGTIVRATTRRLTRGDAAVLRRLDLAATADAAEIVLATIEADGPISLRDLAQRTELGSQLVRTEVNSVRASGRVEAIGGSLLSAAAAANLRTQIHEAVAAHHHRQPTAGGPERTELRAELKLEQALFAALLDQMEENGELALGGSRVALPDHRVELSAAQEAAAARLLRALDAGGATPPALTQAARQAGTDATVIEALSAQGRLVRLTPEVALSADRYGAWLDELRAMFGRQTEVTVADFRDRSKTSRKYALAFLDYLDAQAITRRLGDARVLLERGT
jgi:selenocysteine-specific elongation factor